MAGALAAQGSARGGLQRIGGISAENGEFAFFGERTTAFSNSDIWVLNGASEKPSLVASEGGAVSFEIKASGLRSVPDTVPAGAGHEFAFCDSLDQVSMPAATSILRALSKNAKVKSTENLAEGRVLVAYSVPGGDPPKLELALFDGNPDKGYVLVERKVVTDSGEYCGMQAITPSIRAVLVDEPAGSSDYSAVYLFAVSGPQKNGRE